MPADSDDDAGPDAPREAGGDATGPDAAQGAGGGCDGLGAAWGGSGDGGPSPRAEDAATEARSGTPAESEDPPLVDELTAFLVEHKTVFTGAVLLYGFLVMPWLYENGYEGVGLAGGIAMLGGVILVTVANAQAARESVQNADERRGF
jgi:hypothetical protein